MLYLLLLLAAPSIYENGDIKKGILLQLFGGTKKSFDETGRGKFRLRWQGVVGVTNSAL